MSLWSWLPRFPRHPAHERVIHWLEGVEPVLCPIVELGWIRISSGTYGATVEDALKHLNEYKKNTGWIPCDHPATSGRVAPSSSKTTDWYLADLAKKHGMKWATLDTRANHPNAELVAAEK